MFAKRLLWLLSFSLLPFFLHSQEVEQVCQALLPKVGICGWRVCAFDIDIDGVVLRRNSEAKAVDFSSNGIQGDSVLQSDDLDLGWQAGWRATAELFFDSCDRIELTYTALCEASDSAFADSDADDLFSVFSQFGLAPPGGFASTDQASRHEIKYSSRLYTWEVNYRNHLSLFEIPQFCRLDGSILYGYRYFNLEEQFSYNTDSSINEASMDYEVGASNSMHGLQGGFEAWFPVGDRLDFGFECKAGYYLNCYGQKTKVEAEADLDQPFKEDKSKWGTLWVLEGAAKASYEICSNLYIRAGYLYLRLDEVALAVRNFNRRSPFDEREEKVKNSGRLSFHGMTVGVDFCW